MLAVMKNEWKSESLEWKIMLMLPDLDAQQPTTATLQKSQGEGGNVWHS